MPHCRHVMWHTTQSHYTNVGVALSDAEQLPIAKCEVKTNHRINHHRATAVTTALQQWFILIKTSKSFFILLYILQMNIKVSMKMSLLFHISC